LWLVAYFPTHLALRKIFAASRAEVGMKPFHRGSGVRQY
jgi:hypothetical protein